MATKKQIAMMAARAAAAGMAVKKGELEELDNGGVDQMLERIKVYAAGKVVAETQEKGFAKPDISDVRFGMCCKLVFRIYGIDYMLTRPDIFQERVDSMYKLVTDTFNAATEKRKASPDDQDAKAEAAADRASNDDGVI